MLVNENNSVPYLKSLSSCLNKMVSEGYTEDYKINEKGLESLSSGKTYLPEEVKIVNFFRFEGVSDPDDMSILYVIEVSDGTKGTLVDAFGTYTSGDLGDFMKQVEIIEKRTDKDND